MDAPARPRDSRHRSTSARAVKEANRAASPRDTGESRRFTPALAGIVASLALVLGLALVVRIRERYGTIDEDDIVDADNAEDAREGDAPSAEGDA